MFQLGSRSAFERAVAIFGWIPKTVDSLLGGYYPYSSGEIQGIPFWSSRVVRVRGSWGAANLYGGARKPENSLEMFNRRPESGTRVAKTGLDFSETELAESALPRGLMYGRQRAKRYYRSIWRSSGTLWSGDMRNRRTPMFGCVCDRPADHGDSGHLLKDPERAAWSVKVMDVIG